MIGNMDHARRLTIGLVLLLAATASTAVAANHAGIEAALNATVLEPGKQAVLAIVIDVSNGFHIQSHSPLDKNAIQLEVKVALPEDITALPPVYPPPRIEDYPALGKLSVYTGRLIVYVPLEVKAAAVAGPRTLTVHAGYQACDDTTCFAPENLTTEMRTSIASGGGMPRQPELFRDFNPATATEPGSATANTEPAAEVEVRGMKGQTSWGQWFSRAWFVWTVVAILVLMALGMFGLFTFRLPLGVYTIEPRHDTYVGNFLFGILTAVLSTPCTAPLFPGLLAWAALQAQSGGRMVGVGVVTMVGVGMALPYLLLSAMPELARKLPRTGPWSALIKQMMAFLLLGVAAYFAGQRVLPGGLFVWLIFAIALAAGVFLVYRTAKLMPRARPVTIAALLAVLLAGGMFYFAISWQGQGTTRWQPYSQSALAEARGNKQMVLVDFTANWCFNCKYVERTVFPDAAIRGALEKHRVVMLQADLTRGDAPGWDLLMKLNPSGGIPLTAIYAPKLSEPILLPSIYRPTRLVAALDAAARGVQPVEERPMSDLSAFAIALLVGIIFNVMPCVLPVLPLKAMGFYEVAQHNRAKSVSFGLVFSLGIVATFGVLALLVLPIAR